jgi:hypothetical protein
MREGRPNRKTDQEDDCTARVNKEQAINWQKDYYFSTFSASFQFFKKDFSNFILLILNQLFFALFTHIFPFQKRTSYI